MLEITLKQSSGFLQALADQIGGEVEANGTLRIPENKGKGYLKGFLLDNSIGVMVRNCELNQDLLTRRMDAGNSNERIIISFNNIFPVEEDTNLQSTNISNLPSIQIGKGEMNFEMFYPSKTMYRSILMTINVENLKTLLGSGTKDENEFLNMIINSNQPLLFEEVLSPQIQKVAMEFINNDIPESLGQFYYRIKAEELLCLLFAELYKRENSEVHALNEQDVIRVYQIRDKVISNLSTPPVLNELAEEVGMSESKLKRLFKQIFGSSIYNYYQKFRMQEAAKLLKERNLNVSDVGYQLGFSNLSHFTRLFEKHMGMKPKKYSALNHN